MYAYVIILGIIFQVQGIYTMIKVILQVQDTRLQNETMIENRCHPMSNDRVFKV